MARQPDTDSSERFDRGLFSVSEIFHENTKIRKVAHGPLLIPQSRGPLPAELNYALSHSSRAYRSAPKIPLARASVDIVEPFENVLRARRSIRQYSGAAVSFEHLSRILELSYGITGETLLDDGITALSKRAAPSAGALYSNEIYFVAQRVEGLECGLYHFQPNDHSFECLRLGDLSSDLQHAVLYPEVVTQASIVFLLGAIFQRTRFKYGERGYRFALLDAGHIAQNIYLVCTGLGLGSVAIGGFVDDELNHLIEMNGVDEAVVYTVAVGHPVSVEQQLGSEEFNSA